jgi:hypothetical protein
MASGCIVGDCPVCDYPVFEDEWSGQLYERTEKFVHLGKCAQIYRSKGHLIEENERLKKELNEYKRWFDNHHK